jgi:hypothetical protein
MVLGRVCGVGEEVTVWANALETGSARNRSAKENRCLLILSNSKEGLQPVAEA